MMKVYIAALAAGIAFPTALNAAQDAASQIVVIASPTKNSVTTQGREMFFSKTFDVAITNLGEEPADLSNACFVLLDGDDATYKMDMVDETLIEGELAPGESRKSFVQFSGSDDDVYNASIVRFTPSCEG